eukprot:scaffold71601_cov70-Phaeocystis_antarctica.AAC.1
MGRLTRYGSTRAETAVFSHVVSLPSKRMPPHPQGCVQTAAGPRRRVENGHFLVLASWCCARPVFWRGVALARAA